MFPYMRRTIEECCDADGKLQEPLARDALNGDLVMFDSKDGLTTCAMAMEFIKHLHSCITHLEDDDSDECHEDVRSRADSIAKRKMDEGKVVFVRLTIKEKGDAIRLIIEIGNPYDVKGNALTHARTYAVMCARICIWLKEAFASGCGKVLLIEEGKGADGIYDDALRLNARDSEPLKQGEPT